MRVTCAKRTACKMARVAPTNRPQNRKRRAIVVFCRLCGFWASLWFFAVFVVFWASLWFFGAFHFPSPTDPYSRAHLTRIDEDALKGVYFAFSLILRCLPYFCRKTRPRASYDLLRANSGIVDRLWSVCAFHFPSPADPYSRAHLTRIDEDALEGVYFAFSLILRCLPYFCRKTRPRASYDLLRANSGIVDRLWFLDRA